MEQEMQEIRVRGKATRIRGATWTHDQVLKLFEVWTLPDIYEGLLKDKKKQEIFKRMAATLGTLGVPRTWSECRAKIKNLKADFRKAREKNVGFRYSEEMKKVMNLGGEQRARFESDESEGAGASRGSEGEERPGTSQEQVQDTESPQHSPQVTSPYQEDEPRPPPTQERGGWSHFLFPDLEKGDEQEVDRDPSPPMVITHVVSKVIEPITTVIVPSSSKADNLIQRDLQSAETTVPLPPRVESPAPPPPKVTLLKQRLTQPPKPARPHPPSPSKARKRPQAQAPPDSRKRKLLETLNKKTIETISNLLTDSSRCLLKELQDAEQRFISWEEERRSDERKREESMFAKLIGAMSSASRPSTDSPTEGPTSIPTIVTDFSSISKKLNDIVTDEVKATEESLRQWETKMQRQESRHTEKLFAMIINAIKTPTVND